MTSDSPTSLSPPALTPESTGSTAHTGQSSSPDTSVSSTAVNQKSRRQTAFYPHMNSSNKTQKPFSRSAAKRESVMALGSIEHLQVCLHLKVYLESIYNLNLQYYFTKTGLKSKKR